MSFMNPMYPLGQGPLPVLPGQPGSPYQPQGPIMGAPGLSVPQTNPNLTQPQNVAPRPQQAGPPTFQGPHTTIMPPPQAPPNLYAGGGPMQPGAGQLASVLQNSQGSTAPMAQPGQNVGGINNPIIQKLLPLLGIGGLSALFSILNSNHKPIMPNGFMGGPSGGRLMQ